MSEDYDKLKKQFDTLKAKESNKTLMKLMVECPDYVRSRILTDGQLEIFAETKSQGDSGMTSKFLAELFDISIQDASTRLKVLYDKKYLKRKDQGAESGGTEYVYMVAI